jgi:ceramide glucosyltransferase
MFAILFYILAALLIYFSYKSFRGGIDYRRYFKQELGKPTSDYTPFVTIFAPCKGIDQGMQENFDALLQQDYPEYEVVFILDRADDPAAAVIESAWREGRRQVKLVVARPAEESSQKVENLREGILHADERSEVFVFADSDARPSRTWLRSLVSPLADENVGATTGYRWFISRYATFASELRNVWNASIASSLGPNRRSNFCWGGSTGIRRKIFETLNIRERWRGTLSDDFTVTRAVNEAGLDIYFAPRALIASVEDCTLREVIEFTTRQMKVTRVYSPNLWMMSFFGSALFCIVMLSALMIVIFRDRNDLAVAGAMLTIILVSVFSIGKSYLRLNAVELVLTDYRAKLSRQRLAQLTLWSLAPALFFFNSLVAWISRRMTWRGITYEMVSSTETRLLEREW